MVRRCFPHAAWNLPTRRMRWPAPSPTPIWRERVRDHGGAGMMGKLTGLIDFVGKDDVLLDVGGVG